MDRLAADSTVALPGRDRASAASPPMSALAVCALVSSLLGFLGFTAILGIILGIAGIVVTTNDRRRGRGMAIAAIPISIVMGGVSLVLLLVVFVVAGIREFPSKLQPVLSADASGVVAAAESLRSLASDEFNASVSPERLQTWLGEMAVTHGKLVETRLDPEKPLSRSGPDSVDVNLVGMFVNGRADIHLTLLAGRLFTFQFEDITIDGSSPRSPP